MAQKLLLFSIISVLILQCYSGARFSTTSSDSVDREILDLSERLFDASTNIFNQVRVNLQSRTRSSDVRDDAPAHLLDVSESTLNGIPTIAKMRALFDNYEMDASLREDVTQSEQREENEFLDKIMDTRVMQIAMDYLKQKGIVGADRTSRINLLKKIWFTVYPRAGQKVGSSGFEHVFMNEIKNQAISGLHNWVYFHDQESNNRSNLDYRGYTKSLYLGNKALLIKYRVSYKNINKPVNTMFIGTLPELEMAIYTVCFEMRKMTCNVSMGRKTFSIKAFPFNYHGKRVIGSAYPEF